MAAVMTMPKKLIEGDDAVQRVGRIDEHLAAGAEVDAGASEGAARHQGKQQTEGEEDGEVNVGRDAAQALPSSKRKILASMSVAPRAVGAKPLMVAK